MHPQAMNKIFTQFKVKITKFEVKFVTHFEIKIKTFEAKIVVHA